MSDDGERYPVEGLLEITTRPEGFWVLPPDEQGRVVTALIRIPLLERLDINGRERTVKAYVRLTMLRNARALEHAVRETLGP